MKIPAIRNVIPIRIKGRKASAKPDTYAVIALMNKRYRMVLPVSMVKNMVWG
jgi:hypothetical protein